MQSRVLTAKELLRDMANGGDDGDLYKFLRRQLPYPIPSQILSAAVAAIADVAENPIKYPELHSKLLFLLKSTIYVRPLLTTLHLQSQVTSIRS